VPSVLAYLRLPRSSLLFPVPCFDIKMECMSN
jgi:hypothetical protein